ncbi:alpha-2A adrenergic receptor isoform X1 [Nilaparvata lugens]|uniref:alpha-2A adrenergic receptor isoform X1 n=1 Tax=Nilaparvata lugens TaxID=108931 RepID=UPI00193D04CC|nr:alpha-2A adrenergic receptor isoform X1 [Nilaparvata lugens]XP_039294938.1 alpha-2A adrenergic receptor isoform X1 [Nilaparvata lugens]
MDLLLDGLGGDGGERGANHSSDLLFRFDEDYVVLLNGEQAHNLSLVGGNESLGNNTLDLNGTYIILQSDSLYPSGYSTPHIIVASIVVTLLMVVVVVGNMLVIIAIVTEKALKNIQNWFIASLAVADFFLGLVIMPFSLANELMGYWIFGNWWCDIHSAMDVLLSTASIMNLCLISLDRYWSITQAVDYLKKRTPLRAAVMIALVWLMSAGICIPPLLGWKVQRPEEEFPKCELSKDLGYVVYSALGSFYIPSCIMVFVYIRIYYAAKARARRGIRKAQTSCCLWCCYRARPEAKHPAPPSVTSPVDRNSNSPVPIPIESKPPPIPIVTCDFASDISTSDNAEGPQDPGGGGGGTIATLEIQKDTLKVMSSSSMKGSMPVTGFRGSTLSVNGDVAGTGRGRAPSVGIDPDMVSEFDPSSSDSGVVSRCAVVKPLKLRFCKPIFGRKSSSKAKREVIDMGRISGSPVPDGGGSEGVAAVAPPKIQKPRDPEREKRRLARKKEKRATLILGLIMGSFIACWLPFFSLYILTPICEVCQVPPQAFAIAFWLGYMNSALNPVIYTIFNKDFRRAFRRILFK